MLCNFPQVYRSRVRTKTCKGTNIFKESFFSFFKATSNLGSDIFEEVETSLKKTGINLLSCSNWEIY